MIGAVCGGDDVVPRTLRLRQKRWVEDSCLLSFLSPALWYAVAFIGHSAFIGVVSAGDGDGGDVDTLVLELGDEAVGDVLCQPPGSGLSLPELPFRETTSFQGHDGSVTESVEFSKSRWYNGVGMRRFPSCLSQDNFSAPMISPALMGVFYGPYISRI